jgi:hypothetical protein
MPTPAEIPKMTAQIQLSFFSTICRIEKRKSKTKNGVEFGLEAKRELVIKKYEILARKIRDREILLLKYFLKKKNKRKIVRMENKTSG